MSCRHCVIVGLSLLLMWIHGVDAHSIVFPASTPSDQLPTTPVAKEPSTGSPTKQVTKDLTDDFLVIRYTSCM